MAPRLVLAFDGSAAAGAAIRTAAQLMPGADATVVHVNDEPAPIEPPAVARVGMPAEVLSPSLRSKEHAAQDRAWQLAERGQAIAASAGLRATAEVRESRSIWRAVCDAAYDHSADLIVCGTRGRGPIARTLGSTSSALLHHADRSVLVVPREPEHPAGPAVIGYDGSDAARAAIVRAARLLDGRGAVIANAWYSPETPAFSDAHTLVPTAGGEPSEAFEKPYRASAEEVAGEGVAFAAEHDLDARAVAVNHQDGPWRELAALARAEHASVIVVGSRGRGTIASAVLGSVSAGLVHHADRPVLVVHDS